MQSEISERAYSPNVYKINLWWTYLVVTHGQKSYAYTKKMVIQVKVAEQLDLQQF